ncbi:MAG TPA: iron-sulfur cluster assembly accessory protein [Candidatus Limnocylindria bacterium]
MIEVTPVAQTKLLEVRGIEPARQILRVYVRGKSCSGYVYGLALDEAAAEDDAVFEQGGIRVAIDPMSMQYVDGARIDYVESSEGAGFVVTNERFGGECACGGTGHGTGGCGGGGAGCACGGH